MDVAVVIEAMLDGVLGVRGVEGSGLLGVRGKIQRRGLVLGSADVGGNVGDTTVLDAVVSEAEEDDEELELSEARELLVPLRTSCRNPATGDVKRGEAKPDAEASGVCGGEVGVAQGRTCGS